jgi:spoIIIJ-associated protein
VSESEIEAQEEVVTEFLADLLDAFDLDARVEVNRPDEETIEVSVTGSELGLLIGPKGQTLQAVQELCRSIVQRRLPGQTHARLRVDVGGYRQRRKEALERFVRGIAEEVKATGVQKALEPMSPPDRKIVHDVVNEIDGVVTLSEGEEPRRRVVISPA